METSMKQRSPFMRIAGVMLVLSLLLTCVISSTLAKYTLNSTGTDTATVAKWAFQINKAAVSDSFTLDLFGTILEANVTDLEDNVASDLIAPGTGGAFEMEVKNLSEVDATYGIDFDVENTSSIPVQFSTDRTNWVDWDAQDFDTKINASGSISMADENGDTETITIYWRWAFDDQTQGRPTGQSDATDTALGKAAAEGTAPTLAVTANFTAEQVD